MSEATALNTNSLPDYKLMANSIRALSIDAVSQAKSGHPGAPLGMADITAVLFRHFMQFNPQDPEWMGRDRFVLSNGHASALLYSALHLSGYDLPLEQLKNFRQLNSKTPGHPEYGHTPGVETTTGPLGQGFANAVGMALGQKVLAAQFGEELFARKVYVTVGDGCLMEGISHEAADFAGHHKLNNLIVLFDDNNITIDGTTELATTTDQKARFKNYGFNVVEADGHDYASIYKALESAQTSDKPIFIAFKTTIGFASPSFAGTAKAHGTPFNAEEISATKEKLGWPHGPFEVPNTAYAEWHEATTHGKQAYDAWHKNLKNHPQSKEIEQWLKGDLVKNKALPALTSLKKQAAEEQPKLATRQCGGKCFDALSTVLPNLVSGSADLTGSNNTKGQNASIITPDNFAGQYIHYGVREHAMGAIINGLSLTSALLPAGGTFLAFSDYMKEPIRLAALMGTQAFFIMTHDSIGVGEDGPTHQPIEHLASLRATPNLQVLRPADLSETAECWQLMLEHTTGPSVLVLSRQGVPHLRETFAESNLSAKGAYILRDEPGEHLDGIFIATGTEVHLAIAAHEALLKQGIHTRVVSMPSFELFEQQSSTYKEHVLPHDVSHRVAIEAASPFGWDRYTGPNGHFIGMHGFGASAPAGELYDQFDITAEAAIDHMKKLLNS